MNENLACLLNGHIPTNESFPVCTYCEQPIYYVGDIMWDVKDSWKTKEEMDATNDRPTMGFDLYE